MPEIAQSDSEQAEVSYTLEQLIKVFVLTVSLYVVQPSNTTYKIY